MIDSTRADEESLHKSLKPHLASLYKGKKLLLFRDLLSFAADQDEVTKGNKQLILRMFDKLVHGFNMDGQLEPTGFWKKVGRDEILRMQREAEAATLERARSPPNREHWATEAQLEEIWRQREDMTSSGRWHEADPAQIGRIGGAVAFPVEQGGKTRVIGAELPPSDPDSDSPFAFLPVSFRRDMKQFYYQCGVADPASNAIWCQRPASKMPFGSVTSPLLGPAPKVRRTEKLPSKWSLVFSDCSVFGARTSIHECCGVSECLALILNKACNLLCTLYIDDAHCLSRKQCQVFDAAALDFVMDAMGWWFSHGKSESQNFYLQRVLVVLGMAYTLITEVKCSIQVDPKKLQSLLEKGFLLIQSIEQKRCVESDILTYKGLHRHCAQLDRTKSHLAKALDFWVDDIFVKMIVKAKERRQLLSSVHIMQRAAKKIKPYILSKDRVSAPIAHLYTDAAADNLPEVNRLLAMGRRNGLYEFSLKLGAFLVLPNGEKFSTKLHINTLPPEVANLSIGALEALAASFAASLWILI
eukprot:g19040.t1